MTTQKEGLKQCLLKVDGLYLTQEMKMAAKYLFIGAWLEDINWHSEAKLLNEVMPQHLLGAMKAIKGDSIIEGNVNDKMNTINAVASTFSYIFGWGIGLDEGFVDTSGNIFVAELVDMINA